ncbi:hypothetical protein [Vibrio fluvialis]|uniref:hypothetical protein n=1 Tax=Vibrio fluvialis TaxID=676 RepID=UPI00192C4B73|nr:hypothetical protein [Vibrio fluvialis]MBL4262810.1 hypothetical protein [Vibrio fluvialis]
MQASVSQLITISLSAVIVGYLLTSVTPLKEGVLTDVNVQNYAQELADAVQQSIDLEKEKSQCPALAIDLSIEDLVRDGLLDSKWKNITDISFSLENREVEGIGGGFITYPAFINVKYAPQNTDLLSFFSPSSVVDVSPTDVTYSYRVKRSHRYFSSYIDKTNGCAAE